MPVCHGYLAHQLTRSLLVSILFCTSSIHGQSSRDHLVSVHHEVVIPVNRSSADVTDDSVHKVVTCRSLEEFIPGSIGVPFSTSACVYGPAWNDQKPAEIHLPLNTAQPYGCKATVSCATPVPNSLAAKILVCNKNGVWNPTEYEEAMGRSLLPDCQSAIDLADELLDDKPQIPVDGAFWNDPSGDKFPPKLEPDVNLAFDGQEFKDANPSPTVGYGHPMHLVQTGSLGGENSGSDTCIPLDDTDQRWIVTYNHGSEKIKVGDLAEFKCRNDNYFIRTGTTRVCLPGGGWSILEDPECVAKGCERPPQTDELTATYVDCDGSDGKRNCHVGSDNIFVRMDVEVEYQCRDSETEYVKGEYLFKCVETTSGFEWQPSRWPSCERKRKCAVPVQFPNGYFDMGPGQLVSWGQVATLICRPGYKLEGDSYFKCLPTGEWENLKPSRCVSVDLDYTSNKFIAMTAIGGLLGLLLIVLLIFLVQRHLWLRKSRVSRRRLMDPPMDPRLAAVVAAHPLSDPDRLALIAFADGLQVPLPSYDEAVSQAISQRRNGPPPFDAISTLSGYANRALRRLPSLSSLRSREAVPPMRPLRETGGDPYSAGDISHLSHNATSDGRPAGSSVETMAVSDVSTAVTAETLSTTGTQSTTASCRANAGSLTESTGSLHGLHGSVGMGHNAERTHSVSPLSSSNGESLDSRSAGGTDIEFAPLLEEEQPVDRSEVPVTGCRV